MKPTESDGERPGVRASLNAACTDRWFVPTVAIIVATRLLVWSTAVYSMATLDLSDAANHVEQVPLFASDSIHFRSIVEGGYTHEGDPPTPTSYRVSFFPGYPLLTWPLSRVMPTPIALLLVANVAGIAGLLLSYVWAHGRLGGRAAFGTTLLLAAFPPAMFLSAAYSEGLFLLTVAATLWLLDLRRFTGSSVATALASTLRPTAVVLVPTLAIEAWRSGRVTLRSLLLLLALSVSGGLAYEAFLIVRFGDPFVYFEAQRNWEVITGRPRSSPSATSKAANSEPSAAPDAGKSQRKLNHPPRGSLRWFRTRFTDRTTWAKSMILAVVGVSLIGLCFPGPVPRSYFLIPPLIFLLGYLPGDGVRFFSVPRFLLPSLPAFALVAWWFRRWPIVLAVPALVGMALQCFFAFGFSRGKFFG